MVMELGMTFLTNGYHIFRHILATTGTRLDMMQTVSVFSACLARDTRLFGFIIHF